MNAKLRNMNNQVDLKLKDLPVLTNSKIQLLLVEIESLSLDDFKFCYSFLSDDEKSKCHQFIFPKDKARYVYAKTMTRLVLSQYLNIPANTIKFNYNKEGKPDLVNRPNVKFNISHSEDYLAIAIHPSCDIGVDLEQIPVEDEYIAIAKNYFHENEYQLIINNQNAKNLFYQYWTLKEAFIKSIGKGFYFPLNDFFVRKLKQESFYRVFVKDSTPLLGWRLFHRKLNTNLHLSVCINSNASILKVDSVWLNRLF